MRANPKRANLSRLISAILRVAETRTLPDAFLRAAADMLVLATEWRLRRPNHITPETFAREMASSPIARDVGAANDQHYELPPSFFGLVLGENLKYSCCHYTSPLDTLDKAEAEALARTALLADVADGQMILELGCGWGSLTFFLAEKYGSAKITAVSNSTAQCDYIQSEAARRSLNNITVITSDVSAFTTQAKFDRIVSVEMFEHLSNWASLLQRLHAFLAPDGRVYLHFFSHADRPYRFDHEDPDDWVAQHFFTGGIMPSHDLIERLHIPFEVDHKERWSGKHYARTARDWLSRFDRHRPAIESVLRPVYGDDLCVWMTRWRLFFIATERLFAFREGSLWGVSHYRLRPKLENPGTDH